MSQPVHEVGPPSEAYQRALRSLERSHDDRGISDALGRRKALVRDAVSGEVVAHYVYRLECGHLVAIWTAPLPTTTRHLFCDRCRADRLLVEQVLDAPDDWVPPADRAEAHCPVCLEAAATGTAVPITHRHDG